MHLVLVLSAHPFHPRFYENLSLDTHVSYFGMSFNIY